MRRGRQGFTLVELLVVAGILALLLSILMPTLGQAREIARKTVCQTNLANLGKGWLVYFQDNDNKTPQTYNVNRQVPDCLAQFDYMIYCGSEHTTGRPDYVNAGVLFRDGLVTGHYAYVCPTIERNYSSEPWFTTGDARLSKHDPANRNPWPPLKEFGTFMTYGRRRMNHYDDPGLSFFPYYHPRPRPNEHIMLWCASISIVENPTGFSWMADRFTSGGWAMLSHVPGINVLFLDGHVKRWKDPTWGAKHGTGKVLYDNGIDGWGTDYNWKYDDVWMIIDGYHEPPVGQGR